MNASSSIQRYLPVLGRILLAALFVQSGVGKITHYAGTAQYMAGAGLPLVQVLLPLTILIEVGGGLMLILGWHARLAAFVIFLFIIPVTLVFHAFWAVDPAQAPMQMIQFMKNLAIMGGMLYVTAAGPGPCSLSKEG